MPEVTDVCFFLKAAEVRREGEGAMEIRRHEHLHAGKQRLTFTLGF